MNLTEAVKTRDEINTVSLLLQKYGGDLYRDIWKVGINVSLRISDLLAIRYSDLDLENRRLQLREMKTGKNKKIRLNDTVIQIIQRRRKEFPDDDYLFQVHSNRASGKPVSRQMVARKFKEVGEMLNIALSTHSMRKTKGFSMFNDGKPIEMISKVLNHSSPSVTMAYLGISRDEVLATYDDEYEL
jgi:integrase